MIITLIFIGFLVIGIVGHIMFTRTSRGSALEWISSIIEIVGYIVGICGVLVSLLIIIMCNTGVEKTIHNNQLTYEGLVAQVEAVNSEYEDMSKTEVIQRVTEWNKSVYSAKYWAYNPWTNWFNNKQIADALQYIDMEE